MASSLLNTMYCLGAQTQSLSAYTYSNHWLYKADPQNYIACTQDLTIFVLSTSIPLPKSESVAKLAVEIMHR